MTTFYAIMLIILPGGQEIREEFPSYAECSAAIDARFSDHGAEAVVCHDTGILSGTIRPKARPEDRP